MVYANQNAVFIRDKKRFFSQLDLSKGPDVNFAEIVEKVDDIGYSFLLQNHQALELEFTQMFEQLQEQSSTEKEEFWLYCYYCASLLEAFHRAYSQQSKEAIYRDIKKQIKNRLNNHKVIEADEEAFFALLKNSLLNGLRNLVTAPLHVSRIRDYVAYTNICRLYWAFCRLTLTQGLTIAKNTHLIDKLDAILGTHTDVDKIISVFQAPIGVINYFSVGFFLIRFMIDGGLLLKHTFAPSELEKGASGGAYLYKMSVLPGPSQLDEYKNSYILRENELNNTQTLFYIPKSGNPFRIRSKKEGLHHILDTRLKSLKSVRLTAREVQDTITNYTNHTPEVTTWSERFRYELNKRHCNFANDLIWGAVNFITNFNHITHLSGPMAGYVTAAFLTFDVCMALYKCHLARQEYLVKKSQYLEEIEEIEQSEKPGDKQRLHLEMLRKQLIDLEINFRTKEATFHFIAAAAVLLAIGFTAAMLISPPLLIAGCFLVCTLAAAMYLSAGCYSNYKEKSLRLEQAQLTGKSLAVASKEYEMARNDFIFTMTKNTIVPMVLITTFAICWPAAIVLTAVYLGYEIYHASSQHSDKKAAKQLALTAPLGESETPPLFAVRY